MKPLFSYNVNFTMQQILQVHQQPAKVKQTATFFHIYQEIDIAFLISRTVSDRAKYSYVVRPVYGGKGKNLLFFFR